MLFLARSTPRCGRILACLIAFGWLFLAQASVARAQDTAEEQEQLFQRMLHNPSDIEVTFAYVKAATARGDYEAAIGALERVLFYQPGLARVKYELGSLYYRLGSYEMARRYFREALASPDIDPQTRELIEASQPNAEKQLQQSRFSGFLQTGLRVQTNASYAPTSGTIRLGGQDLTLLPSATQKSDTNWFGIVGLSHDYDLDDQRGDVLETRFTGYVTEQFHLSSLDVGLFDLSFGPRLALAPETLPGVTIKPYIAGGNIWVGGSSYLASGGAGVSMNFPITPQFTVEPFVEYRRVSVNTGDVVPVSTLNSGGFISAGISTSTTINENLRLDVRGVNQFADASVNFESFDQLIGEAALTYTFAPPIEAIKQNWSVSPFGRLIISEFEAANPFIDPTVIRRDNEVTAGLMLNAAVTNTFGISAIVEFDHTGSTLPNFRENNFSVMLGPSARF
jgi:Tetratricopeptide repeat